MRVMTVFGTRPEAIKMAPVVRALQEAPGFESILCVTGQHREMLYQVLEIFGLTPDHDLEVMRPNQSLNGLFARVIAGIDRQLVQRAPDAVLVHGDTSTTLAASLAAFHRRIPVGHVEAGLRTGNLAAPFPEEANRVLADRICTWHFAPTERSRRILLDEGLPAAGVSVTGNTVIDALLWVRDRLRQIPLSRDREVLGTVWPLMETDAPLVLVTGHRRESFGQGFRNICQAIRTLAERHPEAQIVYPVHLNPNVQKPVRETLSDLDNVHLIAPLAYEPFVRLMDRSRFVLTDSGGIQEEAPSLGKPVLVMRETTERPEGVEAGTVALVGTDPAVILEKAEALLADSPLYRSMRRAHNPYGDGRASQRIVEALRAGRPVPESLEKR